MPLAEAARDFELLAVLVAATLLLIGAYRFSVPYPIMLVIGGAAVGLTPGLPEATLEPDVVLIVFLPPLLYSAAFFSSLGDLRDNVRPIGMLAIGTVLATMFGVAVVAHAVVPGMSWQVAFTLGAIVSPTDAIAATAIGSRLSVPRRFITVIEGESLVNDATALIAYRFAVAAVVSGSFSAVDAGIEFLWKAAGGVLVGLVVGFVVARIRRVIDDPPTEIAISLVTPYFAYLPSEGLELSAVLSAVVAGIYLGWLSPQLITPQTRIQAYAFWEILVFISNAALFALVGLALPGVLEGISGEYGAGELVLYAIAVSAAVIAMRFASIYPVAMLAKLFSREVKGTGRPGPLTFLVAFAGMRGAVSLAAALALPLTIEGGAPFPQRDLVIFLTYAVILATLVLQGLTLPWVIDRLGLEIEPDVDIETEARVKAAWAALERLDELETAEWTREATVQRMRGQYEFRIRRFTARLDPDDDGEIEDGSLAFQRLRREVLEAERAEIIRMRNRGLINDEIMRRIERDLDLEDARLEI